MTAARSFAVARLGKPVRKNPIELAGRFVDDGERILREPYLDRVYPAAEAPESFEVAGPRERIYFDPLRVRAAIVTCGGLSPGLNDVIRGLVLQLWHRYGVRSILGIRHGFRGLAADGAEPPLELDPTRVRDIHEQGGTLLGTSRGTPPTAEKVDTLVKLDVDVLFLIGGDGTMRGALDLCREIERRGRDLAVIALPKTIDNDIPFVRRSFGFETAVVVASQAVRAAHIEATSVNGGIGLVKLMGRHSGYIAAAATLASGHANFCLVPEVPFELEGKTGLLALLDQRLEHRGHGLIVVAEGAGQHLLADAPRERDASGNLRLGDIGLFLKQRIGDHFERLGRPAVLKYIDPSYLIRGAPANASDSLFCARLAQNGVHAAMAGKTRLLVGFWHGQMTHVPLDALVGVNKTINPEGELWLNVLAATGQPLRIGKSAPPAEGE